MRSSKPCQHRYCDNNDLACSKQGLRQHQFHSTFLKRMLVKGAMRQFRFGRKTVRAPDGSRLYAIGDVHGCFPLLKALIARIEADSAGRAEAVTKIIFLGDMIDRGPQSKEVCELLYTLRASENVICLKGNHEQAMCDALRGDIEAMRFWFAFGGVATLESWGVDQQLITYASLGDIQLREAIDAFRTLVSPDIVEWMRHLPTSHREGDYFFVHAGIRPGVSLADQAVEDLLWIRDPFLSSWRSHEAMIVHGHSEKGTVALASNRIGIDTAAYRTGCLSAVGLEGAERWIIDTSSPVLSDDQVEEERAVS